MLNRRRAMVGAAATVTLGAGAVAGTRGLQALVEAADPDRVLGVALIARDGRGRVRLAEAAGQAVSGGAAGPRTRPLTLDDPMRVASVSKLVTTLALMRLVENKLVQLDEDVSEALGFQLRHPAHPEIRITPAMLASHTGGLRDTTDYPIPLGGKLVDGFTPGGPLWRNGAWFSPAREQPGGFFAYANVNFAVLAQLMERRTGERFDRLASRLLFQPLGLDCGFNWSGVSQAGRDRASALCRREGDNWVPAVDADPPPAPDVAVLAPADQPRLNAGDYRVGENGWVFSPQGGLRASVRDLDRLAQLLARGGRLERTRLLTRASVNRMAEPRWRLNAAGSNGEPYGGAMRAYGLAVQAPTAREAPDGDALFGRESADWRGHLGQAYGLLSGLWWNVRDSRTLVFAINGTPKTLLPGRRSAFTLWEERIVDVALGKLD